MCGRCQGPLAPGADGLLVCPVCSPAQVPPTDGPTVEAYVQRLWLESWGSAAGGLLCCFLVFFGEFFFIAAGAAAYFGAMSFYRGVNEPNVQQLLGGRFVLYMIGSVLGAVLGAIGLLFGVAVVVLTKAASG